MRVPRLSHLFLFACLLLFLGLAASVQAAPNAVVVATNLKNPRGLAFGQDGALYVAEAGDGGISTYCLPNPEGGPDICYGASGAITRVLNGVQEQIATGFPSLAPPDGSSAAGLNDVAVGSSGQLYALVGLGADPAVRTTQLGPNGLEFGQLYAVAGDGSWTPVVDVAAYEATDNPDDGDIDSNPYALVSAADSFYVTDAGGNDLLLISPNQTGAEGFAYGISTEAVFVGGMAEFPPGSGSMIPYQAVPTGLVIGPDAHRYVGQLTGFPFPVGAANVYEHDGTTTSAYAGGFTNVLDLDFDAAGNLFVLEMFTNGMLSGDPTGRLVKVSPTGTQETIPVDGLITPTGMALSPDGVVCISNMGTSGSAGEVLCLDPAAPTDVSLVSFGGAMGGNMVAIAAGGLLLLLAGGGWLRRRRPI